MAKGSANKRARQEALIQLGKDLTRRSHSHCELCGKSGTKLTAIEVPPLPIEPDLEHSIFICEECRQEMAPENLRSQYWRFLETAIWSELPPVQITAVRLTRQFSLQGEEWATTILENLYLEPAIIRWLDES